MIAMGFHTAHPAGNGHHHWEMIGQHVCTSMLKCTTCMCVFSCMHSAQVIRYLPRKHGSTHQCSTALIKWPDHSCNGLYPPPNPSIMADMPACSAPIESGLLELHPHPATHSLTLTLSLSHKCSNNLSIISTLNTRFMLHTVLVGTSKAFY